MNTSIGVVVEDKLVHQINDKKFAELNGNLQHFISFIFDCSEDFNILSISIINLKLDEFDESILLGLNKLEGSNPENSGR